MTITIRPGSTVLFTGDSITDCRRLESEDGLGSGYPLRVAGEWGLRHPDRPVTWLNTGIGGNKVTDLEARWQTDVLDARPDVVSILVGVNDMGWHTMDPKGYVIPAEEFEAGYERLLAPLAEAGTRLVLIEPFLLPIHGTVEAGVAGVAIGEKEREEWRADLDPKIHVVCKLARRYGAHLLAADGMFAELAAASGPEHWAADGVHPTPAGHAALAEAWLRLVA
ncbi:GDSL family lipase [Streptomyces sp. WM6372]|uniref:SGNH/GDSL hydrolase family protein n=1 Tax=Streptomyces sp. WM6372 TaxID=1415555 RepID=UPI0006AEC162|nr:SGNH/GDSL hydrolase family protein [Streptomyces sp. WM6372]KOU18247.1 GDSL family lipase [Streptomyces sp. WM6372]